IVGDRWPIAMLSCPRSFPRRIRSRIAMPTPSMAARPVAQGRRVPTAGALSATFAFRRDPIGFLRAGLQRHGDLFGFRVMGMPLILINHPDHVQQVFVDRSDNYDKNSWLYRAVQPVLRNGLIGNPGGEFWRRQRRIMNPSFTPGSVALFTRYMTDETLKLLERWATRPGLG